jgi:hypothetical protein
VGRADDTGAVYYNPSGLAELREGRVAVSGAVYLSFNTHYDAVLHIDNTDVPFEESGFVTIPSTYVATRRLGDWVGALSVLVPSSFQENNRLPFTTPNYQSNILLSQNVSELWIGLSAAHKLGEHWSLGLSVFGIQHEETSTLGYDLGNPATMMFGTLLSQTDFNVFGFLATIGASYIATDWLRFGLRAQTPLLQVYGKETAFRAIHPLTLTGAPQTKLDDVTGPANYAMPFDFTLGTALTVSDVLALLADVSLQLGGSYSTFPSSATFNGVVTLKPTPRFNLGMELKPAPAFPVRLGLYYNPSADGGSPGDSNFLKQDFYGLTAGVGLNDVHVRTSVGAFYAWSNGLATPAGGTTGALISSRGIGALLTTAYAF